VDKQIQVFDLVKAFGKQDFVILDNQYKTRLANHPLVRTLWTVGKHFVLVGNTQNWEVELVTGDSQSITGYSKKEIEALKAEFLMRFTIEQDIPFCLNVVKLGMEYMNQRPHEERELIYAVYFYRAIKKGGQVITIQQQSIPVIFDENKVPFVFSNIFTDISYLGVTNVPQGLMVNRFNDETFIIQPDQPDLVKMDDLFSAREKEIVHLLIGGKTSRKIGEELSISMETVRTHRKNILKKAGVQSSTELVSFALTHGIF